MIEGNDIIEMMQKTDSELRGANKSMTHAAARMQTVVWTTVCMLIATIAVVVSTVITAVNNGNRFSDLEARIAVLETLVKEKHDAEDNL